MDKVIDFINVNRERYLDELKAFLAIPSISALPQHAGDVKLCADWCVDEMRRIGMQNVKLVPTPGNPVVYGDWLNAPGAPTILISGTPMHRIKGSNPHQDTLTKIRAITPLSGRVLDTATGLGYTACQASRLAGRVVTIELDPAVVSKIGEEIERDRPAAVRRAAESCGAVCMLKGPTSLIATPEGELFAYAGGGVGLATGGSGDVLAGLAGGLAARGAPPLVALLWAVWLHGEAGRRCAEQTGPLGFLARELAPHILGLMRAV